MDLVADVFHSNLFATTSLTDAVNEIAYVPQRLSELGIFAVSGIATTTAFIEKKGQTLELVQSTPRGGVGQSVTIDRRSAIPLTAAHLQLNDRIYPDEVQNVRGFGTPDQLAGVQQLRDERLRNMSQSIDLTLEYHRLGAIQGVILDADGTTVILDLFDAFGLNEPDDVELDLNASFDADADAAVIKPAITAALREIDETLGGLSPSGYYGFAGDDLFDKLSGHAELRDTLRFQNGMTLREDGRRIFSYGGVTWENYRGAGAVKIADDEARIFPLGVPGLFRNLFAPADTMEAVNTLGLPKYSMASMDPSGKGKFMDLEVQSNPIIYCTRPGVLRRVVIGS
jgi:hypothetical protein